MTDQMDKTSIDGTDEKKVDSPDEIAKKMLLKALARIGGDVVQEDKLKFVGQEFILPAQDAGKVGQAIQFLKEHEKQAEEEHGFDRVFKYRPDDVAHALSITLKKLFGTSGIGKATYSFFGKNPPVFRTIDVGVDKTAQVIKGWTDFPPLEGKIFVGDQDDKELGSLGFLRVEAPRKFRAHIEGLFIALEETLKNESIYKGKAINGAKSPGYLNTGLVDPSQVVYSDEVLRQLGANVWSLIEHTGLMRDMNVPLKRTVMLEGPYGTGKSLAAFLTAQKAVKNGWTFVFCRPEDDLEKTMRTAQLYAPAVVFFEDVDVVAEDGDPQKVSRLLDTFDGITNKGVDLIAVLTTNHIDRIHKGMLRPGRMDAVIHIGELDAHGVEKLIKATTPNELLLDMDYAKIYEAFNGFLPAFAKEAIGRAMRYAIDRTGTKPDFLTTDDFVGAADGLRPQLALMRDAKEGVRKPALDGAFKDLLEEVVHRSAIRDRDDDQILTIGARDEE